MANYTPADVLAMAAPFVKNVPTAAMQYMAFDMAHSTIWRAFPWAWTLKPLTSIALVNGQQDYTIANADFYQPVNVRITRTDLTPNRVQNLSVVKYLPVDVYYQLSWGNFRLISWDRQTQKFRLEAGAQVVSPITMQIDGDYQYNPVKIIAGNFATPLLSPDYYIQPFVEGFIYFLYKFTNDSRENEQLEKFYQQVMEMAADFDFGQDFMYPTDSIGQSLFGNFVSIFGP